MVGLINNAAISRSRWYMEGNVNGRHAGWGTGFSKSMQKPNTEMADGNDAT